jgi:NADP-dependent 3-hydroxy acid dehydrogenase YdfG
MFTLVHGGQSAVTVLITARVMQMWVPAAQLVAFSDTSHCLPAGGVVVTTYGDYTLSFPASVSSSCLDVTFDQSSLCHFDAFIWLLTRTFAIADRFRSQLPKFGSAPDLTLIQCSQPSRFDISSIFTILISYTIFRLRRYGRQSTRVKPTSQWLPTRATELGYVVVPVTTIYGFLISLGANYTKTTRLDTYDFIDPLKSNCAGKAVLITGGNKGIGKGIALAYAKAGASHIAITSRSDAAEVAGEVKEAAASAGRAAPTVLALQVDVLDRKGVTTAAERLEREWGRLDILISNAGFLARYEKLLDSDDDEWWQSYETNIRGMYFVSKAFLPLLLKGGDKTIISISSTGAMHYHVGGSSYQISKLALLRLTEYLMADYADQVRQQAHAFEGGG